MCSSLDLNCHTSHGAASCQSNAPSLSASTSDLAPSFRWERVYEDCVQTRICGTGMFGHGRHARLGASGENSLHRTEKSYGPSRAASAQRRR